MSSCTICSKGIRKGLLCVDCRANGWRNRDGKVVRVKMDVEDPCPGDVELASDEVLAETPSGCKVMMRRKVAERLGWRIRS